MIELPEKRYQELLDVENKMSYLEAGGVDNWEWYGESLSEYWEEKEKEEEIQQEKERLFLIFEEIETVLSLGAFEPSEKGAGYAFSDESEADAFRIFTNAINDAVTLGSKQLNEEDSK